MDQTELERQLECEFDRVCPEGWGYSGDASALLPILRDLPDGAGVDAVLEAAEASLGSDHPGASPS